MTITSPFQHRDTWTGGAVLGAALVARYLFDTLMPPTDYRLRATLLSYAIIVTCLTAGFSGAWRTHSIREGTLTSLSAAAIGAVLSIVGTAVLLAVWHDPATLEAWSAGGGVQEAFLDVPLKVMMLGAVLGISGAVAGKTAAAALRQTMVK